MMFDHGETLAVFYQAKMLPLWLCYQAEWVTLALFHNRSSTITLKPSTIVHSAKIDQNNKKTKYLNIILNRLRT